MSKVTPYNPKGHQGFQRLVVLLLPRGNPRDHPKVIAESQGKTVKGNPREAGSRKGKL